MTKTMLMLTTAAALVAVAAPAAAIVPGGTLINSNGGDGYIDFTSPRRFDLFGGNNSLENLTTYGTVSLGDQVITGQFRYFTRDLDSSRFDPAGYFVNNSYFQLSIDGLPQYSQNFGTFSFAVNAGDSYGFYVQTTDGLGGRGLLTIGAIPEPSSWAMLMAGFGLTGASLRRRRRLPA